jgi:thiamine-phosphate pyrophosphorylase
MDAAPLSRWAARGGADSILTGLMLYAITDRKRLSPEERIAREQLLLDAANWSRSGVAWIQMREKDLNARAQVALARDLLAAIRQQPGSSTRLLINSRPDVALAAGADGVHLTSAKDTLTPDEVRAIYRAAGAPRPWISIACHTPDEAAAARHAGVDCILFAPVFGKSTRTAAGVELRLPGAGLEKLAAACHAAEPVPVYALGGITEENAADCLAAGATGIAAIRLMQQPPEVWRAFAG